MDKDLKIFEAMIHEYQNDIKKVYGYSGIKDGIEIKDDSLKASIESINEHIMVIQLAKLNIISFDGISIIIKDINKRIAIFEEKLKNNIDNNTKKRFLDSNIKRLEQYSTTFKMFLIKK